MFLGGGGGGGRNWELCFSHCMSFDVYPQGISDITFIKTKSICIMNQFLKCLRFFLSLPMLW